MLYSLKKKKLGSPFACFVALHLVTSTNTWIFKSACGDVVMDNALFHVGVTADLWRIRLAVAAGSLQPLVPDNIQFPALKKIG